MNKKNVAGKTAERKSSVGDAAEPAGGDASFEPGEFTERPRAIEKAADAAPVVPIGSGRGFAQPDFAKLRDEAEQGGTVLFEPTLEEKKKLVGTPFIAVHVRLNPSKLRDKGFVSVECVTEAGELLVINDGSTGICDQILESVTPRLKMGEGRRVRIFVRGGLRLSEYDHPQFGPSETHYLSGAAPRKAEKRAAG